jgi:alanine racemase
MADDASGLQNSSTSTEEHFCVPTATITTTSSPLLQRPPEFQWRGTHRIRLSALRHNYSVVEAAACRQHCQVIVVVKADAYGHGALETAQHFCDFSGADAFAVATIEEAVELRQALQRTTTTTTSNTSGGRSMDGSTKSTSTVSSLVSLRPAQIRIMVLGSPVGCPRCFDDYYHFDIEVMVTGPEVAMALMEWCSNDKERKRVQVERAAQDAKQQALDGNISRPPVQHSRTSSTASTTMADDDSTSGDSSSSCGRRKPLPHPSSTLGNVQGQGLAKEVRAILLNQKAAIEAGALAAMPGINGTTTSSSNAPYSPALFSSGNSCESGAAEDDEDGETDKVNQQSAPLTTTGQVFRGIESAANDSRLRQKIQANGQPSTTNRKRRLRWHAVIDSGMGRLGFRAEDDVVSVLKEMVDAEIYHNAPIEFHGMCTHMADAHAESDFTLTQTERFMSCVQRVRDAGISVPTVSIDNSAALLTPSLNHFNPATILASNAKNHGIPTRGFVRTGGALYGQRPSFSELRPVSTLLAAVRHVSILKKGDSVGYDRAYIAPFDVRIATVAIGFADGYPRDLGNGVGKVCIHGCAFPIAGNVTMDMLMVDLGPAEDTGVGSTVVVGDMAILWGPSEEDGDGDEGVIRLQDVAAMLKTTQSALTCNLNKLRIQREYV